MARSDCPRKGCVVQLCPMENNHNESPNWFADEGICSFRRFATHPMVLKQRKIVALGLGPDDGTFTEPMLEAVRRVSKGLRGIDPEHPESEEAWIAQRRRNDGKQ